MAVEIVRYRVRYHGYVQGVGFRMTSVAQARGLDVHGFVRNEPDGSVMMDVEGPPGDVKELMRRIEAAMTGNIDDTQVEEMPPVGVDRGFRIGH
jgi:acylphosphatase